MQCKAVLAIITPRSDQLSNNQATNGNGNGNDAVESWNYALEWGPRNGW
jgi:hypothetical protein